MNRSPLEEICRSTAELLRSAPAPLRRVRISAGDASVELEWPAPAAHSGAEIRAGDGAVSETASDGAQTAETAIGAWHYVRAPMVGTFYHAPEPGAAPFVKVGDHVEAGQQVGIVEAMKLMNSVEATATGRVSEILVADMTRVEYEQPLIELEPDEPAVD